MGKHIWEYSKEEWERLEDEFEEMQSRSHDFKAESDISLHFHFLRECKGKPTKAELTQIFGKETTSIYLKILEEYNLNEKLSDEDFNCLLHIFDSLYGIGDLFGKSFHDHYTDTSKTFAEIILLLKHGKRIEISADIPNKGMQTIKLDDMLVNNSLQHALDNYLYQLMHGVYGNKEGFDEKYFSMLMSKKDLEWIVKDGEKRENRIHNKKGREKKYIPELGRRICEIIQHHSNMFSKLNQTETYCLLGDFFAYNGHLSSCSWEDWEVKSHNEKKDHVKYWVKAYKKLLEVEDSGICDF